MSWMTAKSTKTIGFFAIAGGAAALALALALCGNGIRKKQKLPTKELCETDEKVNEEVESRQMQVQRTNKMKENMPPQLRVKMQLDPVKFSFWNREQVLHLLLFPLLKHACEEGTCEPILYYLGTSTNISTSSSADKTTAVPESMSTKRFNDANCTDHASLCRITIESWNLDSGTFVFSDKSIKSTKSSKRLNFVGRIISLNSTSVRIMHPSLQVTTCLTTGKVSHTMSDNDSTYFELKLTPRWQAEAWKKMFEGLTAFEQKKARRQCEYKAAKLFPNSTKSDNHFVPSHFALSELLDPTKVGAQEFDSIFGTELVAATIQVTNNFDSCTPLPTVLRALTFEYAV